MIRAAVPAGEALNEDGIQSAQARAMLRDATLIAITVPTLCELVWVLSSVYKYTKAEIKLAIQTLCAAASVTCDGRQSTPDCAF